MEKSIQTFKEFYPYYLKEHSNKMCRVLHVVGTTIVIALALTGLYHNVPVLWLFVPIAGYGFAWVGHFFFEKNRPVTLKYPLWSLYSDFKLFFDIVSGRLALDTSKDSYYL